MLAPSIIILLALILYPLGFALRNSFWFWNLQTSAVPLYHSGLDNYRMVFQVTPFTEALKNTLLLAGLGTLAQFWLGMGVALLLHTHLRGMGFCRALLIMPTTLAPVVAGFLFRYLLEPKGGLLPWLLEGIGFPAPPQGILGYAGTALFAIGMVDTWQWTPFFAIVLYAGLLSISEEVKEAAQVDGASPWRMFWSITLPLLRPIAAFLVMIRFMQLFNSFDLRLCADRRRTRHLVAHAQLQPLSRRSGQLQHRFDRCHDLAGGHHRHRHHQSLYHFHLPQAGMVA